MNPSFDKNMRQKAENYRPQPSLSFEKVEVQLKSRRRAKRIRLLSTIAAGLAILLIAFLFIPINKDNNPNALYAKVQHMQNLNDLPIQAYDAYTLHSLYPTDSKSNEKSTF